MKFFFVALNFNRLTSFIINLTLCVARSLPSTTLDNNWYAEVLAREEKCLFLMYFCMMNLNMFPEFCITHTFCFVSDYVNTRAYIWKSLVACKSSLDNT